MRLIMDAQTEARQLGVEAIGTDHLLLSATLQRDGVAAALKRSGVETKAVRDELARAAGGGVSAGNPLEKLFASTAKDELLPFASDTERSLRAALDDAKGRGAELVSPKGLMLSAVAEGASDGGSAAALLASLGVDVAAVVKELKRSDAEAVGAGGERRKGGNSTLEQCSVDLTQRAREGKLDPCVGRADEVRRCMKILVRRRKSNPVLIGDPGVGKTAIAEGIAQRIVDGDAPERLLGMRVLSLELGLLVADTKYRGEFEERLKSVIEEVTQSNETVLFIDEIHTLVGAGAAEGAIDAANLLKPALARGELQCIGATTIAEYRKYIEKDAALERRFQAVKVDEPSVAETASILTGLRPKYEEYHGVKYSDGAIAAAAELGARYISDRFNPDKAIDLIDEAGAALQMEAYDGGGAAGATVGEAEIAEVVADWTGIPVTKLTADERKEMSNLEETLHGRVIGQDGAVSAIARALRRARVGLRDPRRPVASLVFAGPTGVGKTELAKAVAEAYYGSEKAMVRLDMSEYMEAFSVSRLTGPPPGYVGYEAGGQLTEAVRRSPHTLVLFDEIEKAHPDVYNVLLQVLEDGRLTDNKGRVVDFTNAMLVLTSNVGSQQILNIASGGGGGGGYEAMRGAVRREMSSRFRPELLNRLDEVVVFEALSRAEVSEVAQLYLAQLQRRCADEMQISLDLSPALSDAIVERGYSPAYGARPLRRAVQALCEDAVAEASLDGFVGEGESLGLDSDGEGRVLLRNKRGKTRTYEPATAAGGIEGGDAAESAALLSDGLPKANPLGLP